MSCKFKIGDWVCYKKQVCYVNNIWKENSEITTIGITIPEKLQIKINNTTTIGYQTTDLNKVVRLPNKLARLFYL